MHRIATSLLALFSAALASSSQAGALRLRVPSAVAVSGDVILLAHLLPAAAPDSLRAASANVLLGAAPAAGSSRIFTAAEISAAFSSTGISANLQPRIPASVAVRRAGTLLTPADLVPLLTSALALPAPLPASYITLPISIFLPGPAPRLRVLRITPDPILNATTIRLAPVTGTSVVPFDVLVRTRSSNSTRNRPYVGTLARAAASPVDPRRMAALLITSAQSRMFLQVHPLERGDVGQSVRVRLPGSGKTFRATVVALDSLEAHL